MPQSQRLEHLDQVVHDFDRPPRDPGRDEQPLTPPASVRTEENAHQFLRLEQRPREFPISTHRTVVTIEAARVRHQDA